jgi:hypothetical protein
MGAGASDPAQAGGDRRLGKQRHRTPEGVPATGQHGMRRKRRVRRKIVCFWHPSGMHMIFDGFVTGGLRSALRPPATFIPPGWIANR